MIDNAVLRKKLNTFKSSKGVLRKVSDDVVFEVLRAWENWPGSSVDFYREIGLSKTQLAVMIGKGKRLVKKGVMVESDFSEIQIEVPPQASPSSSPGVAELCWDAGRVIKFSSVDHLLEFLKKAV